jgi:hypothetical protein
MRMVASSAGELYLDSVALAQIKFHYQWHCLCSNRLILR